MSEGKTSKVTQAKGQSKQGNLTETPEFPVLPIEDLPKEFQILNEQFNLHLKNHNPKEARLALRPLIAYYIKIKREIPVSIEVGYSKLLILEELEKTKSKR